MELSKRREINLLEISPEEIRQAVRRGELTIAVYGLGHVGAVVAAAFIRAGAFVVGVEVERERLELARRGSAPIRGEPGVAEAFGRGVREGRLHVTSDGVEASRASNVKIVTVPVTLDDQGRSRLDILREVTEDIGKGIGRGDLVVVESSVPPGTTENVVLPILEKRSGMKAERDFGLAYSPERVYEGRALRDLTENYPKVVGAVGPRSLRAAEALYGTISGGGVIRVSNIKVAEAEKIFEGIYRDVNIALANELARLSRALGVDFEEAAKVANTNPYCHLHRPGVGVGGACIPIYPYFALEVASKLNVDLPLTATARRVNESMPFEVVELARKLIKMVGLEPGRVKAAILGLAFRGDVPDPRNSPTYKVVEGLRRLGISEIHVHDPLILEDRRLKDMGARLTRSLEGAVEGASLIIVCTDHSAYKGLKCSRLLELSGLERLVIVDGRDVLEQPPPSESRIAYVGVGRPPLTKSKIKNTA